MKKIGLITAVSGLALAAAVGLSACTSSSVSPTPTPTSSPSETVSPMTPAEAKAAYKKITQASCNAAQSLGVVEAGDTYRLVSVNKDQNYKDFSAAYFEEPDSYNLIWELDGLHSCADWYSFSMAEEAGQEAAIDVTFDPTDSTFTTFEDFGDMGTSNYKYSVRDGKLFTAMNLDPEHENTVTIQYGNITDADRQILVTAVDRYLETLNN
ncbi:MAG: hypothetical protein RIS80_689 [Actinomycetota bacterium]